MGNDAIELGAAGGGHDLLVGCTQTAISDVVADRGAEHENVLLDDADLAAQGILGHVADVDAVDGDGAGIDFVKARQQ